MKSATSERAGARRAGAPRAPDGRQQRAERSREAIVSALFALVGEGVLQPTAQQVAERADVGLRTVFRHFEDMDALFATMAARLSADALPSFTEPRSGAPLAARTEELVGRRARLFERIAPYKRSANVQRWRSPFLGSRHARLVRQLRADLERALPELAALPAETVAAVELVTSFEAWDRLRSDQRLSRKQAEATLLGALRALLAR